MGAKRRGGQECGLAGLLVVSVVLGVMATVAFAALSGQDGDGAKPGSGLSAQVAPAAKADLGAVAESGRALRTGVADQSSTACAVDARTLATAAQTYQVTRGSYPATVDEVVSAGLLSQPPSSPHHTFAFESVGGRSTGRVLVNGLDADAGCASPAAG